jgi:3-oxoadipate enol-lactonase
VTNGLNCRIAGSGPPLILLHPVGLDLSTWDEVGAVLATSHTVIAVDLPGFGRSPSPPRGSRISDYARAVVGLMDDRGIASARFIGASFGGMIAQTIALDFPDRVSVLIPSACPAGIDRSAAPMIAERGTDAEQRGMSAVVDETLRRWFTSPFLASEQIVRFRKKLLADDVAGWSAAWHAIAAFDIRDRLANINVPTLCIAGEVDVSAPVAAMQTIASGIPGARLEVMKGGPHMIHIEQPDRFAALAADFLTEHADR